MRPHRKQMRVRSREADEANVDVVPVIGTEGRGVARCKRATRSTAGTIVRGTTVLVDPGLTPTIPALNLHPGGWHKCCPRPSMMKTCTR